MPRSRLTVPLHRYAAFYILIFCRIGCHYHPLGTDEPSWETEKRKKKGKRQREGAWVRRRCSTMMHTKRKGIQTRGADTMLSVSRSVRIQTDAQTHKYTEGWQHCDRPWMITSWPSGPSPQISLSGSKSGLSLYANQPPFNPTNHGPPRWRPPPITARWLTMPSKINIKPSRRQKRSDITENRRGTGCVEY